MKDASTNLAADTEARRPPPSRWRTLAFAGAAVATVAVGVAGVRWWSVGRYLQSTDDAYVRADIVSVSPRVAGMLVDVNVRDNQHVDAGAVLARIDDSDYRAHAEQAEAAIAAARADITAQEAAAANLDAQTAQQHSAIAAAVAALSARAADAQRAALEHRRQQDLIKQEVASVQQLEAADAEAKRSRAAQLAAGADADAARQRLDVLASERRRIAAALDKARAALAQATAAHELARLDLERCVIVAPVAGRVGQRSLRVGQHVDVGAALLALVPEDAYVVANYKETQLDRISPGQPVSIAVDAFGGAVLSGSVDSLAPASGAQFALLPPDNATGNFTKIVQRIPLRIRVDADAARRADLRPGMSVVTTVDTRQHSHDGG
ncbi:MAG: HlyD family secretion protein [Rudaea sp.]|nr:MULTISPECIES: HlyD family secretion protein [unclassified Rudaea]MBN8887091.1 HlyD family secretion protein [Rudaea sp.]